MSTVAGASSMTMGSLYAMLGLALPSGAAVTADAGAVSPAIAMLSAANESAAIQVGALLQGMGVPSGATSGSGASLTTALLGLSNLDPAAELQRLTSRSAATPGS